jgi:hypothetical protein
VKARYLAILDADQSESASQGAASEGAGTSVPPSSVSGEKSSRHLSLAELVCKRREEEDAHRRRVEDEERSLIAKAAEAGCSPSESDDAADAVIAD